MIYEYLIYNDDKYHSFFVNIFIETLNKYEQVI